MREVKLLSRLNHENIVRYYNSWIERTVIKKDDSSEMETTTSTETEKRPKIIRPDEVSGISKTAFLIGLCCSSLLTITLKNSHLRLKMSKCRLRTTANRKLLLIRVPMSRAATTKTDGECKFGSSFGDLVIFWYRFEVESDGIEFEEPSIEENVAAQSPQSTKSTHSRDSTFENGRQIEFMYIQMEFCEKSTLRNAIDNSVYLDEVRVWRLFREIVEGLTFVAPTDENVIFAFQGWHTSTSRA